MKKASEYLIHAEQCRRLARTVEGEHRDQLLQMAATWDGLAEQRADLVRRHPEIDSDAANAEAAALESDAA